MSKSIWGRVLSPFVEFEPEVAAQEAATPSTVAASTTAAQVTVATVLKTPSDPTLVATLDQSTRAQLIGAMETCGADLVEELTGLLDTLKDSITDEAALYKAALKILMKKGHTLVDIRQDFDKCVGALEAKDREFQAQLKGEYDKRVGSKTAVVADCASKIEAKQAQIKKLQSEISDLGVSSHEAQSDITEEQAKLDLAKSRFSLGFKSLHTELTNNCAKTAQYGEAL
jgi:hypothetical protein